MREWKLRNRNKRYTRKHKLKRQYMTILVLNDMQEADPEAKFRDLCEKYYKIIRQKHLFSGFNNKSMDRFYDSILIFRTRHKI